MLLSFAPLGRQKEIKKEGGEPVRGILTSDPNRWCILGWSEGK